MGPGTKPYRLWPQGGCQSFHPSQINTSVDSLLREEILVSKSKTGWVCGGGVGGCDDKYAETVPFVCSLNPSRITVGLSHHHVSDFVSKLADITKCDL